jgi:hypothetical protein
MSIVMNDVAVRKNEDSQTDLEIMSRSCIIYLNDVRKRLDDYNEVRDGRIRAK